MTVTDLMPMETVIDMFRKLGLRQVREFEFLSFAPVWNSKFMF